MKRIEVIKEIIEILESDTDPRYIDVTYFDLANSILNKLERIGMSPPKVYDNISMRDERKWE